MDEINCCGLRKPPLRKKYLVTTTQTCALYATSEEDAIESAEFVMAVIGPDTENVEAEELED